jgi:NADH dehydrogenase/NADH:ubiquinone oxidoreductase subunit G
MLKTRGGGRSGISSAAAFQTKVAVELLPQLSDVEIEELNQMKYTNRNGRTFEFKPYIEHFRKLGGQQQAKADVKNISQASDEYGNLIKSIKEKIEDFLIEQEAKIDADIKKDWQFIHDAYNSMSREDFVKKFGEKKIQKAMYGQPEKVYYTINMFYATHLGILLRTKSEYLPTFITKAQKMYREKEYGKIDKLIYKLKAHYPSLSNFVMTNFRKGVNGIEFTLTANSPDGQVSIYTQTIYAGGYNIQRLHLRWLMQVSDSLGKKVKIEQG